MEIGLISNEQGSGFSEFSKSLLADENYSELVKNLKWCIENNIEVSQSVMCQMFKLHLR